jgi:hypothetical protein
MSKAYSTAVNCWRKPKRYRNETSKYPVNVWKFWTGDFDMFNKH